MYQTNSNIVNCNSPMISNSNTYGFNRAIENKACLEFSEENGIINDLQVEDQFRNNIENNDQNQNLYHNLLDNNPICINNQTRQQLQYNYNDNVDPNNTLSFALDEINAVINSKDFSDILGNNNNKEEAFQYEVGNEASIPRVQQTSYYDETVERNYPDKTPNNFGDQPQELSIKQPISHYAPDINQIDLIMATNNNDNNHNYNMFATNGTNTTTAYHDMKLKPYVEIMEQPSKCALRFRYKCEGRSAGSLPGVNSTADNKTYPAIKINNYVGRAVVVISCVTKDAPYLAHPHNIVGKEGCKKGICTIVVNNEPNTVRSFTSLGIQCVKRKDIEESLSLRESINVDPFRNGFAHKLNASNIDLNVVRLCFQVFIEGSTPNKCDVPLIPAVSEPIHDKKAMSDLVITKLSHCSAPATGGREVILLCDRIAKDDIQIRFYEERDGKLTWETYLDLSPADIHKQVAICFKTPKYYNENITQPAMARIQLKRMSDNQLSEPRLFQFLPCESDEDIISRKRQKIEWVNMNHYALDNILQRNDNLHHRQQQQHQTEHTQANQPAGSQESSPHPSSSQPKVPPQPRRPQHQPSSSNGGNNNEKSRDQNPLQSHNQHRNKLPQALLPPPTRPQQQAKLSHPPSQQQIQQHDVFMIENNPNLVVRHEIIDDEGKVMRLVDRTGQQSQNAEQQQQQHNQQQESDNQNNGQNRALGSSLDRIDTAELMRDMPFNSNIDLNLQL